MSILELEVEPGIYRAVVVSAKCKKIFLTVYLSSNGNAYLEKLTAISTLIPKSVQAQSGMMTLHGF